MAEIQQNDQVRFVMDGEPVMDACEDLNIPFLCRGGGCGACRAEILEGIENLSPRSANEDWYDKNTGLGEGNRLLCQTKINSGTIKINHIGRAETQETSPELLELSELKPRNPALIIDIDTGNAVSQRLMEMGFVPGTIIEIIKSGEPLIVTLNGSRIALRGTEANNIKVEYLNTEKRDHA